MPLQLVMSLDFMDTEDMTETLTTSLPYRFSLIYDACIRSSAFAEAWLEKFKPKCMNIKVPQPIQFSLLDGQLSCRPVQLVGPIPCPLHFRSASRATLADGRASLLRGVTMCREQWAMVVVVAVVERGHKKKCAVERG